MSERLWHRTSFIPLRIKQKIHLYDMENKYPLKRLSIDVVELCTMGDAPPSRHVHGISTDHHLISLLQPKI